jgi:hypothetical protein
MCLNFGQVKFCQALAALAYNYAIVKRQSNNKRPSYGVAKITKDLRHGAS